MADCRSVKHGALPAQLPAGPTYEVGAALAMELLVVELHPARMSPTDRAEPISAEHLADLVVKRVIRVPFRGPVLEVSCLVARRTLVVKTVGSHSDHQPFVSSERLSWTPKE